MRFGFVTCVQLGLSCMEEIYRCGGHLDLSISLRDDQAVNKSGRVYLDEFCERRGVDLVKVANVNDPEAIEIIKGKGIDWLFIIGWSQIARQDVLEAPNRGVLGMHPTLLPVGRGRASIPWAILKGLPETGVTLFKLDDGVDTGPIISQERVPVGPRETATSLYEKVKDAHRTLIQKTWPRLTAGDVEFRLQNEAAATYWPARRPDDGEIRPSMRVEEVDRLVRAVTHPYPGAFVRWVDGRILRVWAGTPIQRNSEDAKEPVLALSDGRFAATEFQWEAGS